MYNPFGKDLADLTAADLSVLRDVSEGWFVEYKREVPNPQSIAKSVSAFANHHGGWVFYGIAESSDGENTAGEYPGVLAASFPDLQQRIRDAVSSRVSSAPFFDVRVLRGPCDEIELPEDRLVIVLRVPEGLDAPYVHSSGRIFRRVADSSDPVAETDRHILDTLWRRGERRSERLKSFLEREIASSELEKDVPVLTLFLLRDPLYEDGNVSSLDYRRFVELMRTAERGGLPFTGFQSHHDCFIARQIGPDGPGFLSFTWEHCFDGTSILTCPLRYGRVGDDSDQLLIGYDYREAFLGACTEASLRGRKWVDLTHLYSLLVAAIRRQAALIEEGGLSRDLRFVARLRGVWRHMPFLDTEAFIKSLQEHGVPVLQHDQIDVPWTWAEGASLPVDYWDYDDEGIPPDHKAATRPWRTLLSACGLEGVSVTAGDAMEIIKAQERAAVVYAGATEMKVE